MNPKPTKSTFRNPSPFLLLRQLQAMKISEIWGMHKLRCSQVTIFSNLPEDIIIAHILPRLPVKSLLKFMCVSKSWNSSISSKKFIQTQLEISTRNTNFTNQNIIIADWVIVSAIVPILKKSWLYEHTYAFYRCLPKDSRYGKVFLLGCCNGLTCVLLLGTELAETETEGTHFLVWNPSTRKSVKFSRESEQIVGESRVITLSGNCVMYGFGFDESSDEYKVFEGFRTKEGESIVHLYSLKSNSRKRIENHPFVGMSCYAIGGPGTFVNGKLHWLMKHDDDAANTFGLDIISFDVETEMYGVGVEKPIFLDPRRFPTMGVLGGCLSVVCDNSYVRKDVWVLKVYGINESWEKVISIPYDATFGRELILLDILGITPAGEVMFAEGRNSLYIYDLISDSVPRKVESPDFCQLNAGVQSLVWPFSDGDHPVQSQARFTKQQSPIGSNTIGFVLGFSIMYGVAHLQKNPVIFSLLKTGINLLKKRIY